MDPSSLPTAALTPEDEIDAETKRLYDDFFLPCEPYYDEPYTNVKPRTYALTEALKDTLPERCLGSDLVYKHFEVRSTDAARDIVTSFLTYARPGDVEMRRVSTNMTIGASLSSLMRPKPGPTVGQVIKLTVGLLAKACRYALGAAHKECQPREKAIIAGLLYFHRGSYERQQPGLCGSREATDSDDYRQKTWFSAKSVGLLGTHTDVTGPAEMRKALLSIQGAKAEGMRERRSSVKKATLRQQESIDRLFEMVEAVRKESRESRLMSDTSDDSPVGKKRGRDNDLM